MVRGFAYVDEAGQIDISSVQVSEHGAMVNAIVMITYGAIVPTNDWTKVMIETAFHNATRGKGTIRAINISVAQDA